MSYDPVESDPVRPAQSLHVVTLASTEIPL